MELSKGTTLQNGKYRIVEVLGVGGFGITYLAQMRTVAQGELGAIESYSNVAIKEFFMKSCCNRDRATSSVSSSTATNLETFNIFRKKFEKEARILARLKNPGIVPVLEIFQENGTSYYVMEFIAGRSINQLLDEKGVFDIPVALRYINSVGEALKHVHNQKFLHLDVKPDNILVRGNGEPVLIDFGGAKHFTEDGDTESTTTPPVHSDGYSPIEVYSGISSFAPEADVYALAATFYKMITGIRPAKATDLKKHPLKFGDNVPVHIREAIVQAMQVLPENRLKSVDEFLSIANGNSESLIISEPAHEDEVTQFLHPADGEGGSGIPPINREIPGGNAGSDDNGEDTQFMGNTVTKKNVVSPDDPHTGPGPFPETPKKKSRFVPIIIIAAILGCALGFGGFYFMGKKHISAVADSTGLSDAQLCEQLELQIDTIVFNNFGGKDRFLANLNACTDSMDGYKVDACEKVYQAYEKAMGLCDADAKPSLHSGITHENLVYMCGQMRVFADYWKQQCVDMGETAEADNYARLSATWKQREDKLKSPKN